MIRSRATTAAWFCPSGPSDLTSGSPRMWLSSNIGRLFSAMGVVVFGLFAIVGDARTALFYAGFLFIPATLAALMFPEAENDVV